MKPTGWWRRFDFSWPYSLPSKARFLPRRSRQFELSRGRPLQRSPIRTQSSSATNTGFRPVSYPLPAGKKKIIMKKKKGKSFQPRCYSYRGIRQASSTWFIIDLCFLEFGCQGAREGDRSEEDHDDANHRQLPKPAGLLHRFLAYLREEGLDLTIPGMSISSCSQDFRQGFPPVKECWASSQLGWSS